MSAPKIDLRSINETQCCFKFYNCVRCAWAHYDIPCDSDQYICECNPKKPASQSYKQNMEKHT